MMKHALALASAVFFWMPIASLLILIFPFGGLSTWFGALVPTCMISFTGSILLLIGARLDSSRFYWLIPFCLMTFAVLAAGVAIFFLFFLGSFPEETSETFLAMLLLMLAPCSVAVFLSFPIRGTVRSASIYMGTFVSAYSVLTTFFLFIGGYLPMLGLLYLYWMFGMPIIGVCYLACAFLYRKKERAGYEKTGDYQQSEKGH